LIVTSAQAKAGIGVWDPFVRIAHWSLVATVLAAWLTSDGGGRWHEWLGWATLAIVLARIIWGWIGPRHARFTRFVRSPAMTLDYLRRVLARAEPRYIGHNPLGACMVLTLMLGVILVALSGWLMTTDTYWGVPWVEELHEGLTNLLLALVGLHVAGVAFSSIRHRENLVAAMWHGRKRAPARDDVV
jgi:cytochrome b